MEIDDQEPGVTGKLYEILKISRQKELRGFCRNVTSSSDTTEELHMDIMSTNQDLCS